MWSHPPMFKFPPEELANTDAKFKKFISRESNRDFRSKQTLVLLHLSCPRNKHKANFSDTNLQKNISGEINRDFGSTKSLHLPATEIFSDSNLKEFLSGEKNPKTYHFSCVGWFQFRPTFLAYLMRAIQATQAQPHSLIAHDKRRCAKSCPKNKQSIFRAILSTILTNKKRFSVGDQTEKQPCVVNQRVSDTI